MPYHRLPVVTYAPSTIDDLVDWGYSRRHIRRFRLGLDHDRYQPGPKADYPLFLQACRMVGMKRPDLTVRAFAVVVKQYPEARLALVGSGPFQPVVRRLVRRLGLENKVLMPDKDIWFFKAVPGDQKVKLMQQAWAFVHPSVKEGWGMVLTEAAACGTPSIATAVTGQVDAVKDGETGLLISAQPTVEELSQAMLKIIENRPLRERLSRGAIRWASQFHWDKSYQEFKEAISAAAGLRWFSPVKVDRHRLPMISIITPVFNAARVLPEYFAGLAQTTYPRDRLAIIMPDGGSADATRSIAAKHQATVLENPLRTGEAGKAVGIHYVLSQVEERGDNPADHLICLLDSDNIVVDPDWFERMVAPFTRSSIVGAEPWQYIARLTDSPITRYGAMMGLSDPLTLFLGNYDRLNLLTGRWTGLPIRTKNMGDWLVWRVNPKVVPTLGANGAIFRAAFFKEAGLGNYLFDIDTLYQYTRRHPADFAKVKIGIVHIFCRTVQDFVRKQRRRTQDFHYFHSQGLRTYPWRSLNRTGLYQFIAACILVVPLLWQVAKGMVRQADPAWLFHPIACWITLWIYGWGSIRARLIKPQLADRSDWSQS